MKKILCFMSALVMLLGASSTFASSITQSELDKQTKEGNILSDGYTSSSECSNLKDKYNQEFSNYKRSDCFLNGGKYHYFICPSSSACSVNITGTSSTTTVSTGSVPNQDKLDVFLNKITSMRKEINNDTKYKALLTQVKGQLQTLGSKYTSNITISQMLAYLNTGIEKIQKELENNTDVDSFLCELLGNCNVKKECPIMSAPFCEHGAPKLIKTYKNADGCEVKDFECPKLNCPQMMPPICQNGIQPITKGTYKGADGCEFTKYECPTSSSSSSSSSTSSGGGQTDSQKLVTSVYNQILKRNPEQAGLTYWVGQIDTGKVTQSNLSIVIACAGAIGPVGSDKTNAQSWLNQNNVNCGGSSSSTSSGGGATSSSSTSSGGGATSSSSSSSGGPTTTSSSSSTSSSGGGTKDYSGYPSGSWEPQAEMNARYGCTGTVPTYAQVGTLNYVGFQEVPGRNTVWRSLYSLSEADKTSDAWKSCTWYCNIATSWNGSRCVSDGSIRFSTTQVKIGEAISGTVTTAGHTDSYYTCMETPALPNNCASGANFTQLSKNPDWRLSGTSFTLSNYPITSAFQTGQYTGYVAVAENGVVKDPHRTARRHSFTVVPGDTGVSVVTPPSIYLYLGTDVLRGTIQSSDPSNTWACMDAPGASTCSNRSNWSKMPTPGWTQTANGFVLSDFSLAGAARGRYTGYVSIGNNGNLGPSGSSSFTY